MRESVAFPGDPEAHYRFGVFDFDAGTLELHKNGRIVRVRPQTLKLLTLLVGRAGEVVSRDDIQRAVWEADTFVDFEQGVNQCVKELRIALGDAAESPRYIQTLPRRGYRFIAPVERGPLSAASEVPSLPADAPAVISADTSTDGEPAPTRTRWARAYPVRAFGRGAIVGIALASALLGGLIATYAARSGSHPLRPSRLVVLPFSTPDSDPALGVGLATAISSRLAGQQLLPIQSTGRASDNPGVADRDVRSPEAMQGANLELHGRITESEGNLVVLAELKDARTGASVWSDRFRVRSEELFSVEHVISERVVSALRLRLAAADQDRLRRRYTADSTAYQEYLRGRAALVKYTPEGTLEAIQAFEGALKRDPKYALARAGLAMACADMCLRFAPAGEVERWGERTEAEARAALDLDPDLAEAHLARAAAARKREFDWNTTMAASRRALALNPNLDQARFFMAAAYYHLGYMEEALIEMEKGRALRGADVIEPIRIEALTALFGGHFGPARVHLEEVSRLSSQAIGDTYLALAYYYSGSIEQGRTMLESLATQTSASTAARSSAALAGLLASRGEPAAARLRIKQVLDREYRDHHVAYSLGAAYAQLGEAGEAVRWLRTATDTGFPCVTWFERDPLLEPLRRRPEFRDLVAYVRATRESSLSRVN